VLPPTRVRATPDPRGAVIREQIHALVDVTNLYALVVLEQAITKLAYPSGTGCVHHVGAADARRRGCSS
jgi:hypothetical protein